MLVASETKTLEEKFPIERFNEIASQPDNYRLIERVPLTLDVTFPCQLAQSVGDELPILFLDVETTGLESHDVILELGLVRGMYSPSLQKLVTVDRLLSVYEQPPEPIPALITELTGITDEMVEGKQFDEAFIASWFDDNPLIIAHNAAFDRPFFERRFSFAHDLKWGCSCYGVEWGRCGLHHSKKLEHILFHHGYFYEAHRASTDCLALAWAMHVSPQAFSLLLDDVEKCFAVVRAIGAPFDVKDMLKQRGYRWFNGNADMKKHWYRSVDQENLSEERNFLDDLYGGSMHAMYESIDATSRFKS